MNCWLCKQSIQRGQVARLDWLGSPQHPACYAMLEKCSACRHPTHYREDCGYCQGLSNCSEGEPFPNH